MSNEGNGSRSPGVSPWWRTRMRFLTRAGWLRARIPRLRRERRECRGNPHEGPKLFLTNRLVLLSCDAHGFPSRRWAIAIGLGFRLRNFATVGSPEGRGSAEGGCRRHRARNAGFPEGVHQGAPQNAAPIVRAVHSLLGFPAGRSGSPARRRGHLRSSAQRKRNGLGL